MKKIDLHIHTIPVVDKDAHFEFELAMFSEYVSKLAIDAIAITNHNLFDLDQFNSIQESLKNTIVFPGIEIDFEGGHLLLIGEGDLDDFNTKCEEIRQNFESGTPITVDRLKEIFVDLDKYLLIPHYDKKPKVKDSANDALKGHIFAGEVASPKKFHRVIKEQDSLVPVLFSDARIAEEMDVEAYQGSHTFVNTNSDSLSISVIKAALRDKNKVFLSNTGKHGFFEILSNGQALSNGLNVILGGRSSGKTYLLDRISNTFGTEERSVKYIQQFDLVKEDEKKFNEIVLKERSAAREKYLEEFKSVVEEVTKIDQRKTEFELGKYLESLVEFACNEKLHDEFSKAALFTETPFGLRNDRDLEEIIKAVCLLISTVSYKETINKYLPDTSLKSLLVELEKQFKEKAEERLKKCWVNDLIEDTSQRLRHSTASPSIEFNEIEFYAVKLEKEKVKRFNAIANAIKNARVINEDLSFGKFKIQAIGGAYTGAGELKDESRRPIAFSSAFAKYGSPIQFLEELKKMPALEKTELYKYFCKVNYQVLNRYDKKVSGGERAEFNLLKALQDARQYEMLLIDEPESSFDNLFLKDNVNKEIKAISAELPVVVVTHNNTVGMLMNPDYILYTERRIIGGKDEYRIYSGAPGDKEFKTADGKEKIDSYITLMDALEAGEGAYSSRADLYKSFKK
jgi:hypothetical protein